MENYTTQISCFSCYLASGRAIKWIAPSTQNNSWQRHCRIDSKRYIPFAIEKKNTSNYSIRLCFQAQNISVVDISGGCGAMYEIVVETKEFSGLSRVKQHQLITDTLKTEIKDMHGLRIHTSIPDSWNAPQFDCKNYYKTSLN